MVNPTTEENTTERGQGTQGVRQASLRRDDGAVPAGGRQRARQTFGCSEGIWWTDSRCKGPEVGVLEGAGAELG